MLKRQFAPEDAVFQELKDKLHIYGSNGGFGRTSFSHWQETMGNIGPKVFYETLTRGLPGNTVVNIESKSGGDAEMTIVSSYGGKTLLQAERYFSRRHGDLRLNEVSVHESERRNGIGNILLSNQLDMMRLLNLRYAQIRTGRDDGPYYWGLKGVRLKDQSYADIFLRSVESSYERLKDEIDPAIRPDIEKILAEKSLYCIRSLALLPGTLGDKPLGKALMYGNEAVCVIVPEDAAQMEIINHGLRKVDRQREDMLTRYPDVKPSMAKTAEIPSQTSSFKLH
ncbi:MAG: hypothetical protein JWO78_1861 [Micavibrio sp.]|nr:hypothetical protein [Micavibrio sp.]